VPPRLPFHATFVSADRRLVHTSASAARQVPFAELPRALRLVRVLPPLHRNHRRRLERRVCDNCYADLMGIAVTVAFLHRRGGSGAGESPFVFMRCRVVARQGPPGSGRKPESAGVRRSSALRRPWPACRGSFAKLLDYQGPGMSLRTLRGRNQGPGRACPGRTRAIPCPVQAVTSNLQGSSTPQGTWSRSRRMTCADRPRWSSRSLGSMIALYQMAPLWRADNHERSVRALAGGAEL
jgi:hypothetical protein